MWNIKERLSSTPIVDLAAATTLMALPSADPGFTAESNYTSDVLNRFNGTAMLRSMVISATTDNSRCWVTTMLFPLREIST